MAPSAPANFSSKAADYAQAMLAAQAGRLLAWRLPSARRNLALALALLSVGGGALALRLPWLLVLAALNGVLGAQLFCGGLRRLSKPMRLGSGFGLGLFLAFLPLLIDCAGAGLVWGLAFLFLLLFLKVSHALTLLGAVISCAWAVPFWSLGVLLAGADSKLPFILAILGGLAGLGVNLIMGSKKMIAACATGEVSGDMTRLRSNRDRVPGNGQAGRGRCADEIFLRSCGQAQLCSRLILAFSVACWILPLRSALSPDGGYNVFEVIPAESFYAERLSPPLPGVKAAKLSDHFTDFKGDMFFFLKGSLLLFLTITGMPVPATFWLWRILFPLALLACLALIVRAGPRRRRPWEAALSRSMALAAVMLLYMLYLHCNPIFGIPLYLLERVTTNIEFPLSVLLVWGLISWVREANPANSVKVVLLLALLFYLHPFMGLLWLLPVALLAIWQLIFRHLSARALLAMLVAGLFCLVPWLLAFLINTHSIVGTAGILAKEFWNGTQGYAIQPDWLADLIYGSVLGFVGWRLKRPGERALLICCALALFALPFLCGLLRQPCAGALAESGLPFFVVAAVAGGMLWLRSCTGAYRGRRGALLAQRWTASLLAFSAFCIVLLAFVNLRYDFCSVCKSDRTSYAAGRKKL